MKKIILAGVLATMMGSAPVMAATATTTTPAQATTANVQKEATKGLKCRIFRIF